MSHKCYWQQARRLMASLLCVVTVLGCMPTQAFGATNPSQSLGVAGDKTTVLLGNTFVIKDTKQLFPEASAHVQTFGWTHASSDSGFVGTTGMRKRLEAMTLKVPGAPYAGGIRYRVCIQGSGWQSWRRDGKLAGTWGKSKALEAFQVKLYGELAKHYDVYYRAHSQRFGWMAWTKNGKSAGTMGMSKRIEAIQIVILRKGSAAPPKTYKAVVQTYGKSFVR